MSHRFRACCLAMTLLLVAVVASATTTLSFYGQGYWLSMEIGHDVRPEVASISFHAPGDKQGVVLRGNYEVEVFDTRREVLVLTYKGGDPRVEPFTLVVRGNKAALTIGNQRIESQFSWFM